MKTLQLCGCFGRLLVIACATVAIAPAQIAPSSPTSKPADQADSSDAIRLEQFDVTADKDSGYRATNSITATGIGTKIMDTPLAITVLTKEFLDDIGSTEMREALNYVPGITTTPRNESEYGVRGFTGNISYRNGEYRRQNYEAWNVDRVEVVMGPAAVFFGNVRDGGVINYVTTRPTVGKPGAASIELTNVVGTEDYFRFGAFQNVTLSPNVAVRAGWGFLHSHGRATYDYRREVYYGASALWKITKNQQLVLDVEEEHRNNYMASSRGYAMTNSQFLNNPRIPKFAADGVTPTTTRQGLNLIGLTSAPTFDMWAPIFPAPDVYGRYYGYSPDSYEKFVSRVVDLEYTAKIGSSVVWQTMLNWAYDDQPGMRSNNGDQEPLVDGTIRFKFQGFENLRNSYNMKSNVTWKFKLGPTNHTMQAGYQYQEVVSRNPGTISATNAFSSGLLSNFIFYNPRTDLPISGFAQMKLSNQVDTAWSKQHQYNLGYFIVNQSHFFKDRLHFLYGIRSNDTHNSTTVYSQPVTNSPGISTPHPAGWTPQTGLLVQPVHDLSLYVVRSRSITPNYQIDADGNTTAPQTTSGVDVGVKTAFLNGRISSSLTYYTLDKTNITSRDTAKELATGKTPYYIDNNAQASRGMEANFNLSPLDGYQVVIGWSHVFYAHVTESPTPGVIGRALSWTPLDKATVWNRYKFADGPGWIKGLTLGLGTSYIAGARLAGDPNNALRTRPTNTADLLVARDITLRDHRFKAQLNVKNLTNLTYRTGSLGMFAPERSIMLSLSTSFNESRQPAQNKN